VDILAEITPKPEFFADAETAILSIVQKTRDEPGCRRFEVYTSEARETLFLVERWDGKDAYDFHHAQPYVNEIFKRYEGWLAKEPRIIPLIPATP